MATVKEQFKSTWVTTSFSCILFIAVASLIFWNEGLAIVTWTSYKTFLKSAVSVDVTIGHKNDAKFYQGKVIHIIGPIHVLEPLTQPDYNVQVLSAKLKSRVQMYQWIEEEHGRDTSHDSVVSHTEITYSYHKEWRDYIVDSEQFYLRSDHRNPTTMPASPISETLIADHIHIGWTELGMEMKRKFRDYYEITSDSRPDIADIKLHSGMYYHGDPLNHQVGDLRVRFSYAGREGDTYTSIGVLNGVTLVAYESSVGPLVILMKGSHRIENIPYDDVSAWKLRAACWLQTFAALMTLHPTWHTLLLNSRWVSPHLKTRARHTINLGLSVCVTLFITSLAWIYHGEKLGGLLMVISVCPIVYCSSLYPYGNHED